jgi:hypothetical protein
MRNDSHASYVSVPAITPFEQTIHEQIWIYKKTMLGNLFNQCNLFFSLVSWGLNSGP